MNKKHKRKQHVFVLSDDEECINSGSYSQNLEDIGVNGVEKQRKASRKKKKKLNTCGKDSTSALDDPSPVRNNEYRSTSNRSENDDDNDDDVQCLDLNEEEEDIFQSVVKKTTTTSSAPNMSNVSSSSFLSITKTSSTTNYIIQKNDVVGKKKQVQVEEDEEIVKRNKRRKSFKEHRKRARGEFAMEEICVYLDKSLVNGSNGQLIEKSMRKEVNHVKVETLKVACSVQWSRILPKKFSSKFKDHMTSSQQSYDSFQHMSSQASDLTYSNEEYPSNDDENDDGSDNEVEKYDEFECNFILVRLRGETIVGLYQCDTLLTFIKDLRLQNKDKRIILVIEGLNNFLQSREQAKYRHAMQEVRKKKDNHDISPPVNSDKLPTLQEIDEFLTQVQITHRCLIRNTGNVKETTQFLIGITKAIAEAPYKKQLSTLEFNSKSLKRKIAKNYNYKSSDGGAKGTDQSSGSGAGSGVTSISSLSDAWFYQLMEIPSISEKIATAIVNRYPTVHSLLSIYYGNNKLNQRQKSELLKDIRIDGFTDESNRKVGPSASAKIYYFFKTDDPNGPI